jgi:hypothetical protein
MEEQKKELEQFIKNATNEQILEFINNASGPYMKTEFVQCLKKIFVAGLIPRITKGT